MISSLGKNVANTPMVISELTPKSKSQKILENGIMEIMRVLRVIRLESRGRKRGRGVGIFGRTDVPVGSEFLIFLFPPFISFSISWIARDWRCREETFPQKR